MRSLLCLALLCSAGCYVPSFSDPVGAVMRQGEERRRLNEKTLRDWREEWYRQDRLNLDRERLELERQRTYGW